MPSSQSSHRALKIAPRSCDQFEALMTLLLFGGLEYFQQMVLITQHVFHRALHQAVWFMPGVVGSHLTQLLGDVNL